MLPGPRSQPAPEPDAVKRGTRSGRPIGRPRRDVDLEEIRAAPGGQSADPHQARHALTARAAAPVGQLGVDPRAAVALPTLGMDRRDLCRAVSAPAQPSTSVIGVTGASVTVQ
jgi:hypothetical protein